MISHILPGLTPWHDYDTVSLERKKFCHIFSNFIKKRKRSHQKWKHGSLMSQMKPKWIMKKQLSFSSTIKWEFTFIEEVSANNAVTVRTTRQTNKFRSWPGLKRACLISVLSRVLFEKCLFNQKKVPLGTESFIQLIIENLQYCQGLFSNLRYIKEQVSIRPNLAFKGNLTTKGKRKKETKPYILMCPCWWAMDGWL